MAESYAVNGLLLGIVAARRHQISAEQFLMAMQAWILDSSQSLGEILESHGLLSAESRHQLADAIQANLAAHDNDPRHLLAETMQVAEQADDDVGTRTEREHSTRTVAAEATSGPDHVTQPMLPDMPDETELQFTLELRSSQRFHILRPHARGGLGEVYVAEDRELNREVALKEIQPRHADDANSRQRFIMEAEITGGLEHPGIVPVYGLGHHEDGRPYYAMRFIRGENLKEAIGHFHETCRADPTQRGLLLRQLLRRFIDACNAVAYAHSRGVLHRDLKPGNVMLGEFGETLVVDWGLAKAVGRAQSAPELADDAEATLQPRLTDVEDATQTGQIMGTPAYMSPEQAAGRVSQMSARSDVYSLGAILYTLLTNQSPYAGDRSAILQDVQAGRLIPPQKVRADVPRSLAAVCQKAMAMLPSDRYATPQALAADVELWLAGEPNGAYRETMLERGVRISRRHKSLLTAAAALLLTTVLALGIGLQAVSAEQRKTRQERDDKELALRSEEKQRQYAEKLLLQNTIVLFRLTDDVLKQLISRQVAITSSERRFLANLETMYGELTSASGETVAAKHNRVAGLIRLANVRLQLGEADSARDGFSEAIEILNGLLAKDPTNIDSQDLLARTWKGVAGLEFGIGNLAQAEKSSATIV